MPLKKLLLACLVMLSVLSIVGFGQGAAARSGGADIPGVSPVEAAATEALTNPVYLPLIGKQFPFQTVFGVEMRRLNNANGLDKAAAAQATWTRRNALLWMDVEAAEGSYNWTAVSGLEQELINADNQGIQVILVVRGTPAWAQKFPGVSCGPVKPEKLVAFGDFLAAAVARYSQPPFNVRYYQIWNEPDVDPSLVEQIPYLVAGGIKTMLITAGATTVRCWRRFIRASSRPPPPPK